MPQSSLPREVRIRTLDSQFESFLNSDALKEYLEILDIRDNTPERLLDELNIYNTRKAADGHIYESQQAPLNEVLETHREKLFPVYDRLGLVSINKPVKYDYDTIVVLGGSANANYDRSAAALRFLHNDVREVTGLSCFRPLPTSEKKACKHPGIFETEFGSFIFAFNDLFSLTENTEKEVSSYPRNINQAMDIKTYSDAEGRTFRLFASPSLKAAERPGTYDTCVHYLQNIDEGPHRILVITNNQYCNYQFIPFAQAVMESGRDDIDFEIIGCSDDDHLITAEKYKTGQFNGDIRSSIEWIINFRKSLVGDRLTGKGEH